MSDNRNIHVTRYCIGERVLIRDAELHGRVKKIIFTSGCVEFFVVYFDEDKVQRGEWFDESELRSVETRSIPQDSP